MFRDKISKHTSEGNKGVMRVNSSKDDKTMKTLSKLDNVLSKYRKDPTYLLHVPTEEMIIYTLYFCTPLASVLNAKIGEETWSVDRLCMDYLLNSERYIR